MWSLVIERHFEKFRQRPRGEKAGLRRKHWNHMILTILYFAYFCLFSESWSMHCRCKEIVWLFHLAWEAMMISHLLELDFQWRTLGRWRVRYSCTSSCTSLSTRGQHWAHGWTRSKSTFAVSCQRASPGLLQPSHTDMIYTQVLPGYYSGYRTRKPWLGGFSRSRFLPVPSVGISLGLR